MTASSKSPRPSSQPGPSLLWVHIAVTLLTAAEFILLQGIAGGLTTAVYLIAPLLDADAAPGFSHWIRVFQIVSPTITVTGGAAIVISSYIYAKKAQEAYDFAFDAVKRAAESDALIEQANARADQSDVLIEQANARADQSDARADQLSALVEQSHALAAQSNAIAAQATERAQQSDVRAAQAEAEVARLTARLARLENGSAAAPEQAH